MARFVRRKFHDTPSGEVSLSLPRSETFLEVVRKARERRGVALMGVCNVTPDSFSDGGKFYSPLAARAHVDRLLAEGADVLDVGGESTRPQAAPVAATEQLERILGVVRYAAARTCVSVDTTLPEVADACLREGAHTINDVSCLQHPALAEVAASHNAALIVMHARGGQEKMTGFSAYPEDAYGDVLVDVIAEWTLAKRLAIQAGVPSRAVFMDPGLGFSKSARHSAELLRRTGDLVRETGAGVVIGASRKSFLRLVDDEAGPNERLGASIGAALVAAREGAAIVRVHDVRETRQALDAVRVFGHTWGGQSQQGTPP